MPLNNNRAEMRTTNIGSPYFLVSIERLLHKLS